MMNILRQSCFVFALGALVLHGAPAQAGRSCEERMIKADSAIKAMDLAQRTKNALEEANPRFAFIARVGQDLSKYQLRYSHAGLVWRDHPKGRWLVVHELNTCGTAQSDLYDEGLGNFFLDDMFAFETKILIPGPELQNRLENLFAKRKSYLMHWPDYNMVAYPFSTRYQNSNQWLLETYAAAHLDNVGSEPRKEAQAWLKQNGYQPSTLRISTLTRLGGRMFRANVAFDDHPFDRRMAGQIDSVTVDSMFGFFKQRDPAAQVVEIKLP
ncbi:DUF2145 domain-containing protein [Massilia sp. W12]|uniref:DUF2145 domain-containing protein n=1 Tax=Massilia sp. W12 TaxID=3126507 RepID=UPI0030D0A687